MKYEKAKEEIQAEDAALEVFCHEKETPVRMDYRPKRVNVFYDAESKLVCSAPFTA